MLEEEELVVLREAGIISQPGKGRGKRRKAPSKHIVFADSEDQGAFVARVNRTFAELGFWLARAARQYVSMRQTGTATAQQDMMDIEDEAEDLGWKTEDENATRRKDKGKGKADALQDGTDPDSSENAAVSYSYPLSSPSILTSSR